MYIQGNASCCAVSDIIELSDHESAKEAMQAFCLETLGRMVKSRFLPVVQKYYTLGAFYIFTGVVSYGKTRIAYDYGTSFAAYIAKNRLGTVISTDAVANRANHSTHFCKVWVWSPNPRTLEAWWSKHEGTW